jgi:hypothetical protein
MDLENKICPRCDSEMLRSGFDENYICKQCFLELCIYDYKYEFYTLYNIISLNSSLFWNVDGNFCIYKTLTRTIELPFLDFKITSKQLKTLLTFR